MTAYLRQLLLVIRHEMRMVLRSWPFRIVCVLGFGIAVLQMGSLIGLMYAASAETYLGPMFTGANATIMALMNAFQMLTLIVVFFTNSIGSRDGRIGIGDVVAARPLSVGSYVVGRYLGLMLPLTVVMAASLTVILVAENAFGLRTASYRQLVPFFFGFGMLSVAFTASLAAFFSTLLRIRLLASLAALAPILASTFWLTQYSDAFDLSGFTNSSSYSDLIGYGPLAKVVTARLAYVCVTLFFLAATVYLYPRPEPERRSRPAVLTSAVLLCVSVGLVSYMVVGGRQAEARLDDWRGALTTATANRAAAVDRYDMDVRIIPRKGRIRATVTTSLRNRSETATDTFVFMLNPGLRLDKVAMTDGAAVDVARNGPVVELTLDAPLPPDQTVELVWEYGGKVDPKSAWLTEKPPPKNFQEGNAQAVATLIGDLSGWTGRRYCFFLPESQWYPVPNSTYGYEYPDKRPANFATARIRLEMPDNWTGVTQGVLAAEERDGNQTTLEFEVDTPVPQFSLCAGEYTKVSTEINGIECAFYYAPMHKENVDLFAGVGEEISRIVGESLDKIADELQLEYPYRSLSLVEVPASCRTFSDSWEGRNLLVQPGVLFLTESSFFKAYFEQTFKRAEVSTKKQGTGATKEQIRAELLRRYFNGDAFGGDLELNLIPQYWEFQVDPTGPAHPALGSAFTGALAQRVLGRHQRDNLYAIDRIARPVFSIDTGGNQIEAQGWSPFGLPARRLDPDILTVPLAAMSPGLQRERFHILMNKKTDGLFQTLAMAMGKEDWPAFVPAVLEEYRFGPITFEDLQRVARAYSDADVSWVFDQFVSEPVMPGYMITHTEAYEIDTGQREQQFQLVVRIANIEEGNGYVILGIISEGKRASEENTIEREVFFGSHEEKEVRTVLSEKPQYVLVRPASSRNIQPPFEIVYVPEERQDIPGEDSIRTVPAEERELAVIVDDLERGFVTVKVDEESPMRLADRQELDGPVWYPEYRGFRPPRRWQNQRYKTAYGKYLNIRKIKAPGDGSQVAIWSAQLPKDGSYEVFFYAEPARQGRYAITVENGETSQEIDLELKNVKSGWNSLGKYRFSKESQARVKLSDAVRDGSRGSRVYADAVKWVYQDTPDAGQ